MGKTKKCVHTEHCCIEHGCKYGEEDACPVWLGYKPQSYPCESCEPGEENLPSAGEIEKRREDYEGYGPQF